MSGGSKPVLKVFLKRKGEGEPKFVDLAAFWQRDNGMLGGSLAREVVAIKVRDRDGKEHVIRAEDCAKDGSYYVNVRDERDVVPMSVVKNAVDAAKAKRQQQREDMAPPEFGDDDIPFAIPYSTDI